MICNFKGTSARTIGNEQSRKQKKTFICETDTIYAFQLKSLPETHVLVLNLKSNASIESDLIIRLAYSEYKFRE